MLPNLINQLCLNSLFVSWRAVHWPSLWVKCHKNRKIGVFLNLLQMKILLQKHLLPGYSQVLRNITLTRSNIKTIVVTASRSEIDRRFFESFFTPVHFGDDLTKYQCTKNKNWNLHYKLFENIYALFMLLCPFEILLHI